MTGAELFVACLEAAGIDVIFGVPGEENSDLMLALHGSSVRFVLTRHEQSAAFMASVHGRLTGRPAGCLATLGPGATNLVTGVADATQDFAPLLAITGQGETDRLAVSESHQVVDLTALFAPITKHSQTLMDANDIPGVVAEALRIATAPRPGAVHLSLPVDVAGQTTDAEPRTVPPPARVVAHADTIRNAADLMSQAKRPMIVAGAGVIRAGAADSVATFATAHDIPLATTFMGNGILAPDSPLNLGTIGQPFAEPVDHAAQGADLIVAIGFDPIEMSPTQFASGGLAHVLHMAETPAAVDLGWHIAGDVVGDLAQSITALSQMLGGQRWGLFDAAAEAQALYSAARNRTPDAADPDCPVPADILSVVEDALTPDDTVVSGVGLHKLKIARSLAAKRPGQIIIANGLAGMGIALPGAMVAAELRTVGRVFAIVGDGEFLMNVQDMETAARLQSPITVLLWEDGGYGLIEEKQAVEEGSHVDLSFGNPGWADLCRAFGWAHKSVDRLSGLASALRSSRDHDGPLLITMKVDYSDGMGAD